MDQPYTAGANNRIKFAMYHQQWTYGINTLDQLGGSGKPVLVTEYRPEMKGKVFCPACGCPLFRSPEEKDNDRGGRDAYFAHRRGIKTECPLRTKKAEGKQYSSFEEAAQAVQDGKLVVVRGFLQDRPVVPDKTAKPYDQTAVEDLDGEPVDVPISRHTGKKFNLPSKLTTIRGLCRNFDQNLLKYYFFPNAQHAHLLMDALRWSHGFGETTDTPVLVYGKIVGVWDGGNGNPWNVRTIHLSFPKHAGYADFSFKTTVAIADDHSIDKNAIGRVALAFGRVVVVGAGLALRNLKWGEIALLPEKYENLINKLDLQ